MRVLVPILSLKEEPFISVEQSSRNTWAQTSNENIELFYVYGQENKDEKYVKESNELYVNSPDGKNIKLNGVTYYNNVLQKTIAIFKYALNNFEFDFLFRTNISPYVNLDNLYKFLLQQSSSNFYGGCFGGRQWASGLGLIFSRDVVELIISSLDRFKLSGADDLWFGNVLNQLKIPKSQITPPVFHFSACTSSSLKEDENLLKRDKSFENRIIFRCGATSSERHVDAAISRQELIHKLYK